MICVRPGTFRDKQQWSISSFSLRLGQHLKASLTVRLGSEGRGLLIYSRSSRPAILFARDLRWLGSSRERIPCLPRVFPQCNRPVKNATYVTLDPLKVLAFCMCGVIDAFASVMIGDGSKGGAQWYSRWYVAKVWTTARTVEAVNASRDKYIYHMAATSCLTFDGWAEG